jgi:hypothetical protein
LPAITIILHFHQFIMGHFIECLGEIQYDVSLYTIMKISASSTGFTGW